MSAQPFPCPHCRVPLRVSTSLPPGSLVRCPKCQAAVAIGFPSAIPISPPSPLPPAPAPVPRAEPAAPRAEPVTPKAEDDWSSLHSEPPARSAQLAPVRRQQSGRLLISVAIAASVFVFAGIAVGGYLADRDRIWSGRDKLEQASRELGKVKLDVTVSGGKRKWDRTDLGEVASSSREGVKDITDRVKNGLDVLAVPLPGDELTPGKTWQASQPFLLTLPAITSESVTLDLTYTCRGVRRRGDRTEAVVAMSGGLRELDTRTLHLTGEAEGTAALDPATGEVVQARLTVAMSLQMALRSAVVRSSGSFEVQMRRRADEKEADPEGLGGRWVVTGGKFEGKDTAGGQQWHFGPDAIEVLGNRKETRACGCCSSNG